MSILSKLDHCTNCSVPLLQQEAFCPYCGQKNLDRKTSLWAFFKEFIGEYTRLDAKMLKSLLLLIRKPGYLTKEFWAGKRMTYLKPTQLFLFSGLIAFLTLNWLIELHPDAGTFIQFTPSKDIDTQVGDNIFEEHMIQNMKRARDEPNALVKNILGRLPLVLLVLMPFFALIMKVFFRKKSPYLVEHFVHLLHIHAFSFIVIFLFSFIALIGLYTQILLFIGIFVIAVYIFLSMKRVYAEKNGRLLWKFVALSLIYWLIMPGLSLLSGMFISLIS